MNMRELIAGGLLVVILAFPAAAAGPGVPCPWDLNGDGDVGINDFLGLLAAWGPNPGHPADFDGDGNVGITDFLELLANWGPCPACGPGAGPCFESHAGPGCDDVACCTVVCAVDPVCCASQWDSQCVQEAFSLCADPPGACCLPDATCLEPVMADACAASGGVFQGGGSTCAGVTCPDLIGACCLPDGTCAELEPDACDAAGGFFHGIDVDCIDIQCSFIECPGTGECLSANGTPGCSIGECCNFVCSVAPACCAVTWDASCAVLAAEICGDCGDPQSGNCFVANGTPGCTDAACCAAVCALDPFCCFTLWDQLCVDGAAENCNQLNCGDPARCQVPDQVFAFLSNSVEFTQADSFVMSAPDDAPVNGLCWWGAYYSSQNCGPGPDNFTLNYYVDDGGLPGALLASFNQGAGTLSVGPPLATGLVIQSGSATEYVHAASHADLFLSPGVCYWIEIYNTGPALPCKWFWETSSDGDGFSAHTTSGGPWENRTKDFAFCLNVPIFGAPECPCPLECPPGAVDEPEACGDDINGGCNDDPPVFTPAACGDVICGTAWADGNFRDTDWYLVDHPGGGLTATLTSQFPGTVFIFDIDLGTCTGDIESIGCSDDCAPINEASASLAAGDYVIIVVPGDCAGNGIFDGIPCGTSNEYTLEITCPPTGMCCTGSNCQSTTEPQCTAMGGVYGGDGTSCNAEGACCLGQSLCITASAAACFFQGGVFIGVCANCAGVDCSCDSGAGACCLPGGTCNVVPPGVCALGGGIYQGDCTTCSACP
ncbi:MAG: hypothetical protein ACYSU7_14825 [Planctomycetota bacterium]|jgi:hypothetical protein